MDCSRTQSGEGDYSMAGVGNCTRVAATRGSSRRKFMQAVMKLGKRASFRTARFSLRSAHGSSSSTTARP